MTDDILSKWEAEAKETIAWCTKTPEPFPYNQSKQILTLIDLVRKKDVALMYYSDFYQVKYQSQADPQREVTERCHGKVAEYALALTEKLK